MKYGWAVVVPVGLLVLIIGGLPAIFDPDGQPNPESIILNDESDYQRKAKDYAELDKRQEALDTCTAMEGQYSESAQELCLLDVYNVLGDIDGEIEVYEKSLDRELADGDSGSLTRSVLEGLKEERDKKK